MGRKNRNKIMKEKDPTKDQQKLEDEEERLFLDEEKRQSILQNMEDNRFNVIWNTRRAMLEYCNKSAIPICDYMVINIFQDFIEYLEE